MNAESQAALYLAFDGGGTATRAGLYDAAGALLAETRGGPSNPVAGGVGACVETLVALGRTLLDEQGGEGLLEIGAGISGARNAPIRDAIGPRLLGAFHARRVVVASDVDTLVHANVGEGAGIVVIAGTGSSVVARNAGGESRLYGGRGALFGDDGSAYQIAVSALRSAAAGIDGLGDSTKLVDVLPRAAGLNHFAELVGWCRNAAKDDVARLAPAVVECAQSGDRGAQTCLQMQAELLARLTVAAARRSGMEIDTPVYLSGGLFEHCPPYEAAYRAAFGKTPLHADPALAPCRGHRAALELVRSPEPPSAATVVTGRPGVAAAVQSPTESMDENAVPLDQLNARGIADRMHQADHEAVEALAGALPAIASLMERIARSFREGGRLIYMGAGTSGRLGVLDASECPPTFGVEPGQVVGIIAGGDEALRASGEGVEDREDAAASDLRALRPAVGPRDVVVGIAASGTTPYVLAALATAREAGAFTALLACNPGVRTVADCLVVLNTGPEVLPGSTRLKAGTATKLALNMLSTGAMALSGRVFEGRMVYVRPSNAKLRRRARGIVSSLTGLPDSNAAALLEAAGDHIPVAVLMHRLKLDRPAAESRLAAAKGDLREALG